MTNRGIARVVASTRTSDGDGVGLHRAFPGSALMDIDPFLLLDEMGPSQYGPGEARGFPDHPHRGFETVTYLLEGQFEHRDSRGNHGVLRPGDVQWMTAGSGLVHSETPGADLVRNGGRLHGFQLWVNLPRRDKMVPPRYQELPGAKIPAARSAASDLEVRVVAGEALGATARIETHTPILYLHFLLQPGAEHVQSVPQDYNAFAYVIEGAGVFGREAKPVTQRQLVIFANDGGSVLLSNQAEAALSLLLIAGRPLGEPVARYGPFVMNTREELQQAVEDYRSGRMGQI